jgi:hypothetical protein
MPLVLHLDQRVVLKHLQLRLRMLLKVVQV